VASFDALPHNDRLVDLVVCDEQSLGSAAPSREEIMRILRPKGSAYLRAGGDWGAVHKPKDNNTGDWTHWAHDPANTLYSSDSMVGRIEGIQWYIPQQWHSDVVLSSNGVLLIAGHNVQGFNKDAYSFISARNAFNGTLYWRKREDNKTEEGDNLRFNVIRGADCVQSICLDSTHAYGVITSYGKLQKVHLRNGDLTVLENSIYVEPTNNKEERGGVPPIVARYEDLLFQAYRCSVVALDPSTGAREWSYRVNESQPDSNIFEITIGGGKVFLSCGSASEPAFYHYRGRTSKIESIVALNTEGEYQWTYDQIEDSLAFGPIYRDGNLFLQQCYPSRHSVHTRRIAKIDAADGNRLRSIEFPADYKENDRRFRMSLTDDVLSLVSTSDAPEENGRVYKIKPDDLTLADSLFEGVVTSGAHCSYYRFAPRGANAAQVGFLDFASESWHQSYITRNTCNQPLTPSNGLLYSDGGVCKCWAFFHGVIALQCSTETQYTPVPDNQRLEQGVTMDFPPAPSQWPMPMEWPMLFHDPSHSRAADIMLGDSMEFDFEVDVPLSQLSGSIGADLRNDNANLGRLTPPVIADSMLFFASFNEHTVYAFDALKDGTPKWSYTAGGRIDSPPTIYRGLCIFGCRDGYIYALRADNGQLVWRFLAAPARRSIMIAGQLESVWPVHGSVSILNGSLFATAGRHTSANGGLFLYKLDPLTGEMEAKNVIYNDRLWSYDDTRATDWKFHGLEMGAVTSPLVANVKRDLLFINLHAIDPSALEWAFIRDTAAFPEDGRIFPGAPSNPYTIKSPGLRAYPRPLRESTIIFREFEGQFWAWNSRKKGTGFIRKRGPFEPEAQENPFMHQGNYLYVSTGAKHSTNTLQRYALDEHGDLLSRNGEPVVDTVLDEMRANTDFRSGQSGGMIVSGSIVALAGRAEKDDHCVLYKMGVGQVDIEPLGAQPVKHGIAAAYGKIYVTLNNGRVRVFNSTGEPDTSEPVSIAAKGEAHGSALASSLKKAIVTATGAKRGGKADALPSTVPASMGKAKRSAVMPAALEEELEEAPRNGALQEMWLGVFGETVYDLLESESYPDNPTETSIIPSLSPEAQHRDYYGVRIRAWLSPPVSGEYGFQITTEHEGVVVVSADGDTKAPTIVAATRPEYSKNAPVSKVHLEAGREYHVEVLFTQVEGMDIYEVKWVRPDGVVESVPISALMPVE
ncbi:MAG: PQQ-binding-like beta-propeller repeat protein, partial [Chitinivibrionales bacterium]|nr:PQQ-binding-like beta-propeller repeat protein [Chitinivibrionales bacterium]